MERGCPYLYTGSKFRVIWPSVLIIQGGLQQPPLRKICLGKPLRRTRVKGALDNCNIIPRLFPKKIEIFIPLDVLALVMTACWVWVLSSNCTYFWWNMNITSIFYFSKSTSLNTQHSGLWNTLGMMLFTKDLIKWKRIDRISWKAWYLVYSPL